jgi:hypothetical protein
VARLVPAALILLYQHATVAAMILAKISLVSGRSLELVHLELTSTYYGMLEGYPNALMNDARLKYLAKRRESEYASPPRYLITPPRRYPDPTTESRPFGPIEVLPPVYCLALFHSDRINQELNPVLYQSWLEVVWFQENADGPVAEFVTAAVRDLAWDELAEDYEP